jgi:integrase
MDADLRARSVRWRTESDKLGLERVTPLTEGAYEALEARSETRAWNRGLLHPPGAPSTRPCSRHLVRDWWRKAEDPAGVEPKRGGGWHSLRRKFASNLVDEPSKVSADLGGWKNTQTIVECYHTPDQERPRAALSAREAAGGG